MKIIINTDNNISLTDEMRKPLEATIASALDRFAEYFTRIEVKISDENGDKSGNCDKICLLEVRLKGMQPTVVTGQGDTIDNALSRAIDKIKVSLDEAIERSRNY